MKTRIPILAALLLAAPITAADTEVEVWLDPSMLPFVPTPVIASAMAPSDPGSKCSGVDAVSSGPVPHYVDNVRVHVEVDGCVVVVAEVFWTVDGRTYTGVVDAATGAVTRIQEIAQSPHDVAGAKVESTMVGGTRPPTTTVTTEGGDVDECQTDCGPGPAWTYRESHTWLHFWAKSGSGNENVKTNLNWRYAGTHRETTWWDNRCDADGVWRDDACSGQMVNGQWASGHGEFHATTWPHDYHSWDTTITIQSDQSTTGSCTASGDLPWSYGHTCDTGPGNV